ncbi:MAG: hypothetical protein RR355_00280 [Oscillospiraceae bacterium]
MNKSTKEIGFSKFKKLYTGFNVCVIIVAIIIDLSIRLTPLIADTQWWFEIDDNYIFYVYAAICTIATLSSAFISIIIGTLSTKILGLPLKTVLEMVSEEFSISLFIKQSLITVVLGTLFLAANLCNAMTITIVLVTLFFIENTVQLWNVITKDDFVKPLIEQHISVSSNKMESIEVISLLNAWSAQLKVAVENDADYEIDQYTGLINLLMQKMYKKENSDILTVFGRNVANISTIALSKLGLCRCTSLVSRLYMNVFQQEKGYFVTQTIIENFKDFQFYSEQQIASLNCINDFFDFISENTDIENLYFVIYSFFNSIEKNRNISEDCFFDFAQQYFNTICAFTSCESTNDIFSKCILSIFKNSVLLNEDRDFRERIYCVIIKALHTKNLYSSEKSFIYTIGNIFTALYFYVFWEKETFTARHREELQSLMSQVVKSKDNVHISLYYLIQENCKAVFDFLVEQATSAEFYEGMFEYYPRGMGAKTVIWSRDSKLVLAFEFYCIFWYEFNLFPCYFDIKKDKVNISEILSKFNTSEKTLSALARENVLQLGMWLKEDDLIDERFLEANFDKINDLVKQYQGKSHATSQDISLEETNRTLKQLFSKDQNSAFTPALPISDSREYQLESMFVFNSQTSMDIAHGVKNEIGKIISEHIKAHFSFVDVNFTLSGVTEMLGALKNDTYTFYNYRYIDDLAFTKDVRQTDEFKSIEEIYNEMVPLPYNQFQEKFFVKNTPVKYNVEVTNHQYKELSQIEIDDWLTSFKIADNKYKIQEAVYTQAEANQYLHKHFRRTLTTIKVVSNVHLLKGLRVGINLRKQYGKELQE